VLHDLFVPLATFFNLILLVTSGIAAFYFLLFLLDPMLVVKINWKFKEYLFCTKRFT